ncbi:uncharacterized protein C8A04DRAFT_39750 [Dichotomopilus funicola]|uniref:EKC/KEOPS complex subunit BUD32 n=1 Tax=Dichotomopilus funicola TaxID=1934379 RepID=A0AAN6UZ63_9PEZI|nr:hypothetical protein C8A04DRAFT_39750 [Dichotomopilus funicola]
MSSALFGTSSEAIPQSLRDELDGNVFRGVDGFFAKYFENKSWSATAQKKLQEAKSAEVIRKLSAQASELAQLTLTHCGLNLHFRSQPLTKPAGPLSASVYLETSHLPSVAGNTRVVGEFHHENAAPVAVEDNDDILRLCGRALEVFKAQSARLFLHGFRVCGTTLELWVFDRSGAYSSGELDLAQRPDLLVQVLVSYAMMGDQESGFNTFVKHLGPVGSDGGYVAFDQGNKLYLRPKLIAAPSYLVGLGTTCYPASVSPTGEPDAVIEQLKQARERKVWGVLQLLGSQDLGSVADLRSGLQFPGPFVNRIFSCVATAPLGRPIQKFTSIPELLHALSDLVKALRSLYVDAGIIHRDIAIKNLFLAPHRSSTDGPKGVLIDFDQALDLATASPEQPLVGSDGFMAIGILSGQRHTYRHDLESLFYVFLWFAIGNDHEHDDACDILEGLPKTSRLWKWCSLDFRSVGRAKAADMSPKGFEAILDEFSADFAPLRGVAWELHALIFPLRDGRVFTGTDTEQVAVEGLYTAMADAFERGVLAPQN